MAILGTALGTVLGTSLGTDLAAAGGAPPVLDWPLQMAATYPTMAWWDPSTGYTLNGATVSAWVDRISGYSVANATGSQQPTYTASAISGRPGLTFARASSQRLTGAAALAAAISATTTTNCTVLVEIIANAAADTTGRFAFAAGGATTTVRSAVTGCRRPVADMITRIAVGGGIADGSIVLGTVKHCITLQYTGTQMLSFVDGAASSTTAITSNGGAATICAIGANDAAAAISGFFDGIVADVVVIPGVVSASDRQAGEAWFAARFP